MTYEYVALIKTQRGFIETPRGSWVRSPLWHEQRRDTQKVKFQDHLARVKSLQAPLPFHLRIIPAFRAFWRILTTGYIYG